MNGVQNIFSGRKRGQEARVCAPFAGGKQPADVTSRPVPSVAAGS